MAQVFKLLQFYFVYFNKYNKIITYIGYIFDYICNYYLYYNIFVSNYIQAFFRGILTFV